MAGDASIPTHASAQLDGKDRSANEVGLILIIG